MKKILSIVLAIVMIAALSCVCFAEGDKCLKFKNGEGYRAYYIWTSVKDNGSTFKYEFDIFGKAGTTVTIDTEAPGFSTTYAIKANDTWEHVVIDVTLTAERQDPTGHCLRIYTAGDTTIPDYYVDNLKLTVGDAVPTKDFNDGKADAWDYGSWIGGGIEVVDVPAPHDNPATADMTAVIALVGVIACAGVAVVAKKH